MPSPLTGPVDPNQLSLNIDCVLHCTALDEKPTLEEALNLIEALEKRNQELQAMIDGELPF